MVVDCQTLRLVYLLHGSIQSLQSGPECHRETEELEIPWFLKLYHSRAAALSSSLTSQLEQAGPVPVYAKLMLLAILRNMTAAVSNYRLVTPSSDF